MRVRLDTAGRFLRSADAYVRVEQGAGLAVAAVAGEPEQGLADLRGGPDHPLPQHLLPVHRAARRDERVRGGDQAVGGERGRLPQEGGPVGAEADAVQFGGEQREAGGGPVRGLDEQRVRLTAAALAAQSGQCAHGLDGVAARLVVQRLASGLRRRGLPGGSGEAGAAGVRPVFGAGAGAGAAGRVAAGGVSCASIIPAKRALPRGGAFRAAWAWWPGLRR
ncbi:hypothetical protein SAV31267_076630 [Streptomyces avermitilis]|uniref:Uncharacterized protein n=1 Tax=Streptomyces avermitilis TaxID=33903 RepID=A0A4D4N112_STRAX|nr:hypothetical protein SAV31267_076630 [Streptomyces avermitilis]